MFDKKLSDSEKGVAIILVLLHHLFTVPFLQEHNISFFPFSMQQFTWLCLNLKICVGMFVFLTAFGMTRQLRNMQQMDKESLFKYSVGRYIKLEFNFFIICLLGFISYLIIGGGIIRYTQLYNINNNLILTVLYIIIDAAGLHIYFGTPTLNVTWWYMTVAYLMIFLVPIFVILYKKMGKLLLVVCIFLGNLGYELSVLNPYLFALAMGIWAAEENVLEKLYQKFCDKNKIFQVIEMLFVFIIILALIYIRGKTNSVSIYLIDGIEPILIGFLLMMIKYFVNPIVNLLSFFGRYSMNIFLLHTFIYLYFFTDYIYKFKNWMLIFLTCFGSSLVLSILIEIFKKKGGFYILVNTIIQKIENGKQNLYKPE